MAALDINDIFLFVYDVVLNKNQSGQISESAFNEAIAIINLDLFRKYSGIPEDYQVGRPISRMGWQNSTVISDDLRNFVITTQIQRATNGYFPYPTDYALWSSLTYDYVINGQCATPGQFQQIPLEDLTDAELRTRLISTIKPPSLDYPVFGWNSLGFEVYPKQLNTLNLVYLQNPVTPFRAFNQLPNGQTTYNAGLSTQFTWPQTMFPNICVRIAQYFAVSIREDAVVQWMEDKINKGTT
jgi:hypothetical protein